MSESQQGSDISPTQPSCGKELNRYTAEEAAYLIWKDYAEIAFFDGKDWRAVADYRPYYFYGYRADWKRNFEQR